MRFRRFLSGLLSAALVVGLLVLPPASAAGTSGFTDIADARTADAAEMLRLLEMCIRDRLLCCGFVMQ